MSRSHWSIWNRRQRTKRPTLIFDVMESRTLLAAGSFTFFAAPPSPIIQFQPASSFTVITVTVNNQRLLDAVRDLFLSLDAAFGENGTGATEEATSSIQSNVTVISQLAATGTEDAVVRLNDDVTDIIDTGTITTPQRATLIADLQQIVAASGISGSVVTATANSALGVDTQETDAVLGTDLTEPNTNDTTLASQKRGQSVPASSAGSSLLAPSPSGVLGGSGALSAGFRKLMDDFKTALAKSQAVTKAQQAAVTRDFASLTAEAHRADAQAVTKLRADLDALAKVGINDDTRATIGNDVKALLQSTGVSDSLVTKTISDFQPILNAADLDPTALNTILSDLANVLSSRPSTITPMGSWWLGGRPR